MWPCVRPWTTMHVFSQEWGWAGLWPSVCLADTAEPSGLPPWRPCTWGMTAGWAEAPFAGRNSWPGGSERITSWKLIGFWWALVGFAQKQKPRGFLTPRADKSVSQKPTFGRLSPWSAVILTSFISFLYNPSVQISCLRSFRWKSGEISGWVW